MLRSRAILGSVPIFRFQEVSSTMDVAKHFIKSIGAGDAVPHAKKILEVPNAKPASVSIQSEQFKNASTGKCAPFAVTSEVQHSGRGTNGREWKTHVSGNLAVSIVVPTESVPMSVLPVLPLLVGVSARSCIERVVRRCCSTSTNSEGGGGGEEGISTNGLSLKWPNDVLCDGKKVMGVLIESEGDYLIIGVGINVGESPVIATADGSREATCLRDYFKMEANAVSAALKVLAGEGGAATLHATDEEEQVFEFSNVWCALSDFVGSQLCHEIIQRLHSNNSTAPSSSAADVRKAIVAEFSQHMSTSIVLRKRNDVDARGERGAEVIPVSLSEWGHLNVRHLADGRIETLSADYLN